MGLICSGSPRFDIAAPQLQSLQSLPAATVPSPLRLLAIFRPAAHKLESSYEVLLTKASSYNDEGKFLHPWIASIAASRL